MMNSNPKPGGRRFKDLGDVLTGLVLLGFSLLLLFYLVPQHIGEPAVLNNPMMSPKWLPRIVGGLMLLFSILLIVQGMLAVGKPEEDGRRLDTGHWLRFALMVLAVGIYVSLFETLGAVISGILATLILFVAHPIRTWWVYGLAVILPAVVTLLFVKVMNVPLPVIPF